ncbi:hypothetical protein [Moorena sp. SIO3A2]|uniref:hypothetical protein n=1 Tax=Moorena sp. SIO3A2 TaxID=2607841 RepID=UPI0013B61E87|nr:hypothetical protein [Moorena sp. SIO3A2]NER87859.1 hypothetical protein [Moorena sp. SIO3A2]
MPTLQLSQFSILHSTLFLVLVGIAHFIDRGSILIFLSNAHPTIISILNSSFYIIFGIGGHCPFHGSAFNFDLSKQCPPYDYRDSILNSQFFILHYFWYWWALPISWFGVQF